MSEGTSFHEVRPWWERTKFCAESNPSGCHSSFFTQLECKTEVRDDGVPVKRCIQLRKRILHCPNKDPVAEEHQHVTEEVRFHDESSTPTGETHLHCQSPQGADVGQALDQVIRLAEDLQSELSPNVVLDTPPAPHPAPARTPGTEWITHHGLFSHLRRWQSTSPARPSMQGASPPWQDYAGKFEDV